MFQLTYSKEKGTLNIWLDDTEMLELEQAAVNGVITDEITVDLQKGRNNFIISGEDCSCEFSVTLTMDDISQIASFGGGSTINQSGGSKFEGEQCITAADHSINQLSGLPMPVFSAHGG